MCKGFIALSVFLFPIVPTAATAITIDDFSAGPIDVTLDQSDQVLDVVQVDLPETAVVGGTRSVKVLLDEPSLVVGAEARAIIDLNTGFFQVNTNTNLEAISLSYGDGPGQTLNLDLTDYSAFRIDVIAAASLGGAFFTLGSREGENIRGSYGFSIIPLPASDTPYSVMIPFDDFGTKMDFSDIDFIEFSGGAGRELVLNGIFAIPEPTTASLLIASVPLFVFTRRHLRSKKGGVKKVQVPYA